MKRIICFVFGIVAFSGCYYDNSSELYPAASLNTNCDSVGITFNTHIGPIYSQYCVNGCHSSTVAESGIVLDNYAFAIVTDDNTLIAAIEHTGPFPMPNGGSKLSDCNINQIKTWIQNGKPE